MTDVSIVRTLPDAHRVKAATKDESVRWEGVMWTIPRVDEVVGIGSDLYWVERVAWQLDGEKAGTVVLIVRPMPMKRVMLELTLFDGAIITRSSTMTLSLPDDELPDAIGKEARTRTIRLLTAVEDVPLPGQLPAWDEMEGRKSDDR